MLWAAPRAGGNVKRMAEEIISAVEQIAPTLPKDVKYKVLVDPSEFIRAAINNVFHEVAIGAGLAVLVLFLFIGSFRNTLTAAIEIPISMVLAFILMRLTGMNLNIISLGGLALSAGMNVDASVVVMENIFRHFDEARARGETEGMSYAAKLRLITRAVNEVRFALLASTAASLVVFVPLAFTSGLSNAILGDLAKTVVFSHGLSAIVALILVPTVRLQLMSRRAPSAHDHSPFERFIRAAETGYASALTWFIGHRAFRLGSYVALAGLLAALTLVILPRLPREVVGKPDTDWMFIALNTKGNTLVSQMEAQTDEQEARLLSKFGNDIQYTFVQVRGSNRSSIMARLKDKSRMQELWKAMESEFANTPFFKFRVEPWNPAEMPLPDPPKLRVLVRGEKIEERVKIAREAAMALEEKQILPRIWTEPDVDREEGIVLRPNLDQWAETPADKDRASLRFTPVDLADLARVATSGRRVGLLPVDGRATDIYLRYPDGMINTAEELGAMPVGVGAKLVPLRALSRVSVEELPATIYRENGREAFIILGRADGSTQVKTEEVVAKAKQALAGFKGVTFEDAEHEIHEAIDQLSFALAMSVILIFLTLVLQFGGIVDAVLVMVAVPLGLIGVLLSLFLFGSTLSLNSVLGVILLNGIAVANSIILVDFIKRLVAAGRTPLEAAAEAGRKRLRPILITSLTTILGMMPIALGMGEGGRILQPLGIAVSGGLWFSMALTLFVVPALQVAWLESRAKRAERRAARAAGLAPLATEPSA